MASCLASVGRPNPSRGGGGERFFSHENTSAPLSETRRNFVQNVCNLPCCHKERTCEGTAVTTHNLFKLGPCFEFIWLGSPTAPLNLTSRLHRKEPPPYDVWVTWSPPEKNGGVPVAQYSLEYKDLNSSWTYARKLTTNNTYMWISKTDEAYVYEVRVTARNHFGLGNASNTLTVYFGGTLSFNLPNKRSN